ncbi:MAG: Copper chaperone CopZ [Syntrophomonadaceae bacterium]|nr:Copper chaperone CopZ [Bacillota bacterium]
METLTLKIGGMTCNHCKMKVGKALRTMDGVENVQVDINTGQTTVSFDSARLRAEDLRAVVSEAGYELI